jgi:YD repeat-containing protein
VSCVKIVVLSGIALNTRHKRADEALKLASTGSKQARRDVSLARAWMWFKRYSDVRQGDWCELRASTWSYASGITAPEGREFDAAGDALGRLTSETLPAKRTISYKYDSDGNLISLTPPSRPAHTFEYDELRRHEWLAHQHRLRQRQRQPHLQPIRFTLE